jgi:hypothetical protein
MQAKMETHTKREEISCFEELDVLFGELYASSVAETRGQYIATLGSTKFEYFFLQFLVIKNLDPNLDSQKSRIQRCESLR